MKKVFAFLLVLTMLCCLAACGNEGDEVLTLAGDDPSGNSKDIYTFEYRGVTIHMGDLWLGKTGALIEKCGEPVSSSASNSCAFQGLDKTFTYNGFIVSTYPDNGVDYVLSIQFTDDSCATPAGIRIGSTEKALTDAYGAGEKSENSIVFTQGKNQISAVLADGVVKALNYGYIVN